MIPFKCISSGTEGIRVRNGPRKIPKPEFQSKHHCARWQVFSVPGIGILRRGRRYKTFDSSMSSYRKHTRDIWDSKVPFTLSIARKCLGVKKSHLVECSRSSKISKNGRQGAKKNTGNSQGPRKAPNHKLLIVGRPRPLLLSRRHIP